jgi:hypothetical protein
MMAVAPVIASEAKQSSSRELGEAALDCRVAAFLAMTGRGL